MYLQTCQTSLAGSHVLCPYISQGLFMVCLNCHGLEQTTWICTFLYENAQASLIVCCAEVLFLMVQLNPIALRKTKIVYNFVFLSAKGFNVNGTLFRKQLKTSFSVGVSFLRKEFMPVGTNSFV